MKTTRIISAHGLSKNSISLLRAYCHLLKTQLRDNWVFHITEGSMAEIIVVSNNYPTVSISKQTKVVIIVGEKENLKKGITPRNMVKYHLQFPFTSSQLIKILNKISYKLASDNTPSSMKPKFSIRKILTNFIYKKYKYNETTIQDISNTEIPLTDKLLKLSDPLFYKNLKVVFLGRPGSGKTTAIVSAQTKNLVVCDVNATDSVGLLKKQTTIGIDYCDCNFISGVRLKLFGTPGQGRYSYLQMQTVNRANIYVILIDLTSVAPFSEFHYYNNILKSPTANTNAIKLIAFTHYDIKEHDVNSLSKEIKRKCSGQIITAILDPRDRKEVRTLLEKIALLSLSRRSLSSVYSENSVVLNL